MPALTKYTGQWTAVQARHVLRRTVFGPTFEMVKTSLTQGMEDTVSTLLADLPEPQQPLKSIPDGTGSNRLDDPGARQGETWVNAPVFPNINPPMLRNRVLRARSKSLYSWTMLQILDSGMNIREKMTLFWHNHFVVGQAVIPHREFHYYSLLRRHATGNVKTLTKAITIDTSMLTYLSGALNTNRAPNENYSRELLELFTIGKGPLVAPGDYTHYTEDDVQAMAQVLTGWRVAPVSDPKTLTASFDSRRHTEGSKTLSHRFGKKVIEENGADEYADLIDVIFEQEECSRFLCRKIYRWFVNSYIAADVEQTIIAEMAALLRENGYSVKPVLRALLTSEHFYVQTACLIKSPVDLIFSSSRGLNTMPPEDGVEARYNHAYNYYVMAADLEQELFQHPDVAGWKAYYQEPQRDMLWINNLLLPKRHEFCGLLISGGRFSFNDEPYSVNESVPVLDILGQLANPSDVHMLIDGLAEHLFCYAISEEQRTVLKELLIPGLPDYEWSLEYSAYEQSPNDQGIRESIEGKLRTLISVMVRMSEFQVM